MAHTHSHGPGEAHDTSSERVLQRAFFLIGGFMMVELIGGLYTNSLTLLADAGHMFLDATALGLSWWAARIARREQDHSLSYGYHRFQVLAAFVNGLTLIGLVGFILFEAVSRLSTPEPMLPGPALVIATIGFAINLIALRWLHATHGNMNVRAAALHVLGDLLGSAAAITAALVVMFSGWLYADPLLALVIAVILGRGAWKILRESGHILAEGVPHDINLGEIKTTLAGAVPGVIDVHHVHAWALTADRPLLTLHAQLEQNVDVQPAVAQMKAILNDRFGIDHSTIQVEQGGCPDETPAPETETAPAKAGLDDDRHAH